MSNNLGSLVIVRHGQSEYNLKNVFAGWVNAKLTQKGIDDAKQSGVDTKKYNFTPDIVYSTRLERAYNTAVEFLAGLGVSGLEIKKVDAMLERHYGGLTGMNKAEAKEKFGDEEFQKYRRSYDTPPPAMEVSHPSHPENPAAADKVIGMPTTGKGTESLSDVVARVKPFYDAELAPQLKAGKNILIVAHGNSLRALSMIIEGMTPEQVSKYEIGNTEPIKFNFTLKNGELALESKEVVETSAAGKH
jgi:2,3-bisphosphoglycerate-dependent phosphoglycerate mutase